MTEDDQPTEEDISSALCKIGDHEKYTTDEVKIALNNLFTWRFTSDNNPDECARISKEFMELGGMPRILNFIQGNKDNVVFMLRASEVINIFLYSGSNNEHLENSLKLGQIFVEHKGVEMMLSIIQEKYIGELDIDQLHTLTCIFAGLGCTIWNMNAKNMVDIDKFLPIIDAGISTLAILSNINTHDTAVARVKERIFMFLGDFVHCNAEMIDNDDFREKNIFQECVNAMKNPVDNTWKYDKDVWEEASKFFYECCKENRKIFSREGDFEVIVPFCIQFMKENPDHSSASFVFELLSKASDTIGRKKMITSNKGLLDVLGTIADCGNDNVSNGTRDCAIALIFGES